MEKEMKFTWHEPRKKSQSYEPRITLSEKSISINPTCYKQFFGEKEYAKIGYDKEKKIMIFVPVTKGEQGMKLVRNINSNMRYIKADKIYERLEIGFATRNEYRCSWNEANKGIIIYLNDPIK